MLHCCSTSGGYWVVSQGQNFRAKKKFWTDLPTLFFFFTLATGNWKFFVAAFSLVRPYVVNLVISRAAACTLAGTEVRCCAMFLLVSLRYMLRLTGFISHTTYMLLVSQSNKAPCFKNRPYDVHFPTIIMKKSVTLFLHERPLQHLRCTLLSPSELPCHSPRFPPTVLSTVRSESSTTRTPNECSADVRRRRKDGAVQRRTSRWPAV